MGERQRPVFAARPLQLAAVLVAPPIGAAHGLRLCPRADNAAVAIPVPDQPLGGERERVSSVATHEATEHTHKQTHTCHGLSSYPDLRLGLSYKKVSALEARQRPIQVNYLALAERLT